MLLDSLDNKDGLWFNQSGLRPNTHYAGSCCEWCDDLARGRAVGNTPPQGMINGEKCADWMCGNPDYCAGRGYGQTYTPQPSVTFSTPTTEGEWSNHPGFIGGTWWKDFWMPKKAEAERHDKEQNKVNREHPFSEDDTCNELDEKIEKLDSQINKISVGGGKERVQSRQLKTRETRRLDIKDMWNKKDCSQQLIDEQAAEFDAKVAKLFGEAQSRVDARSKEDNSLMNVAIGVGVLVIGGVLVLSLRRKRQ